MNCMYFVAIVLPDWLNQKVLAYKNWMAANFNCKVGLKSPAHITLVPPFWTSTDSEERLKTALFAIAAETSAFEMTTANFSSFATRTLFVAVNESLHLTELKQRVDAGINYQAYGFRKDDRSFHPHITIATRDLHKKDFAEAWSYFQDKQLEEKFLVDGLSLLKHNGKVWDVIFTAPLSSQKG